MSHFPHSTIEDRRYLIGLAREIGATIDGVPASVTGARLNFAVVRPRQDTGEGVEFAWSTVAHILDNGGKFFS